MVDGETRQKSSEVSGREAETRAEQRMEQSNEKTEKQDERRGLVCERCGVVSVSSKYRLRVVWC